MGGGGWVEGGPDLGSWGKGREGVCQGHFWHISGPFQSASRCVFFPTLSPATWQCSRVDGREEKEARRSTSCRPRDAGCGRPFAAGEEVKAVAKEKKDNSRLFASCRGRRCAIPAALKNCTKSFGQQRGFVCVLGIAATLQ